MAEVESGKHRVALLFPVLAVVFVAALDLTVVAPILPQVISDLGINTVDADRYSWIVLSYLVAYTVTVPLTGRISDYLGRIPVFVGATLLFAAGSALTALAGQLACAQDRDAPRTPTERRLAAAWAGVLGVAPEEVGRQDDFFDRGGTSLSAVKLVVALDRAVSLKDIVRHPVLADLAGLLDDGAQREPDRAPALPDEGALLG